MTSKEEELRDEYMRQTANGDFRISMLSVDGCIITMQLTMCGVPIAEQTALSINTPFTGEWVVCLKPVDYMTYLDPVRSVDGERFGSSESDCGDMEH